MNTSKPAGITRRDLFKKSFVSAVGAIGAGSIVGSALVTGKANAQSASTALYPKYFPIDNFTPEIDLAGKVAVITGASLGNGLATGNALSALGVDVIGTSRNVKKVQNPPSFPLLNLDITKPDSVDDFMDKLTKRLHGRKVDIVINNAGRAVFGNAVPNPNKKGKINDDHYLDQQQLGIETLYRGHVRMTNNLLPLMPTSGYARLLFTVSIAGYSCGGTDPFSAFLSTYVASKRALLGYANTLRASLQFSGSNIGIATVNPVFMHTSWGGPDPNRTIFTDLNVDSAGLTGDPLRDQLFQTVQQLIGNALDPSFVGNTYAQLLRMNQMPPNVVVGSRVEPYASQGQTAIVETLELAENAESAFTFGPG